jgi:hypothetical protein
VKLDWKRGVKKEELRFVLIDIHPRGITKGLEKIMYVVGFTNSGGSHHQGIIYKLVVGNGRFDAMKGEPS